MSEHSAIEWTDATWNPIRGCTKVSPGCKHCYAKTFAERFRGVAGSSYERGFDLRLAPEMLTAPLRWTAPKMVFVNSMSDLFHEGVPDEYVDAVCEVMAQTPWHTYQVLTKRSQRMRLLLSSKLKRFARMAHIWWGVSVEDRQHGLPRIADLLASPARVRFLSVEPLLEDLGALSLSGIHWVIVGGESGPGARLIEHSWVAGIRDQCHAASVAFFFKQWGGVRKKQAGRLIDGRAYDEMPPRVLVPMPCRTERARLMSTVDETATTWTGVEIAAAVPRRRQQS